MLPYTLASLGLDEDAVNEMITSNPCFRSFVVGYAAERDLRDRWLRRPELEYLGKPRDHDRKNKGDGLIRYNGHTIRVEAKTVQSTTIVERDGVKHGRFQIDGTGRRDVLLPDGETVFCTNLLATDIDVVAVNLYPFRYERQWAFICGKDLDRSRFAGYSEEARGQLLATTMPISEDIPAPFSTDLFEILDRYLEDA